MKKLLPILSILFLLSPITAQAALTDNIISYWKLDESSGDAADSASTNNLTNTNTVTYSAGQINNGANFAAASSQHLLVADNASLDPAGSFSVSLWYKPNTNNPGASDYFLVEKSAGGQLFWFDHYGNPGHIQFQTFLSGGNVNADTTSGFTAGTWYHLVGVFTSGSKVELFKNGTSIASTNTLLTAPVTGTAAFNIGGRAGQYTDGSIDEVGYWNRALTQTEITSLYNSGIGIQYPFGVSGPLQSIVGLVRSLWIW